MRFAFWRRDKPAAEDAPPSRFAADDGKPVDPAHALRIRTRRRLIGAAALLLAVAIVVPMLLDPLPRAVPDTIPIDIPGDKTPFTPRLSPPTAEPATGPIAPPPDAATAPARSDAAGRADTAASGTADAPPGKGKADVTADKGKSDVATDKSKADAAGKARPEGADRAVGAEPGVAKAEGGTTDKADEARRAEDILAGRADAARPDPKSVKGGKFVVQAAAPASEAAARQLADKLKKGGFVAFTEKIETKDGTRYRVRLGPYATRDDAEQVRARLKANGVAGNTVAL